MIKVLNIMTSNLNYNGIGMSLLNYYNNINEKKIRMDFLVPNIVDDELRNIFTKKGNKLFELEHKGKKMHQARPLKYCRELYKILKNEKYDIVHAHGSSSMLFLQLMTAKCAGIKIRIAHSRNTQSDFDILNSIFKPLFNLSYTESFACGKEAGIWLFGKKQNITIVPNGKDSKMFRFSKDKRNKYRELYGLKDRIVIGHIGNFNHQKNHNFLIDVFNQLYKNDKRYYLILAGKGQLESEIRNKVEDLGLKDSVLFLGQIPVEEVSRVLNAMDIMVFPSLYEGFPNVLIEWQMNGLPCVISDKITKDVKITELVTFLPIDTIEPWANTIRNIKVQDRNENNEKIISQVQEAGYDIEKNAKMLERKYEELYEKYYKKNK